jgi:SOS-response transcriptional repressor LexA
MRVTVKAQISSRLREIRQELFGEHGGPELARRLQLPARTWYNYESGVTVPAEVLLHFIDQTGTNPLWLLTGQGPKYRGNSEDQILARLTPEQLIRRGLEKLEQEPHEVVVVASASHHGEISSPFVAVELIPLSALDQPMPPSEGHVLAYRQWIPHPRETVAVRLADDAMAPILPSGSVVAVDRAQRDPTTLQGRMVAAMPVGGQPMIRWLDLAGRHVILRPNQPSQQFPLIPLEPGEGGRWPILGQVVWSWSRFTGG